MEAAGLALAVLPVLMAAAQNYNRCLDPLRRYRRFAKEAQAYCKEIDVQRTIFRNECRNLLEEVVDHDTASGMLNTLAAENTVWVDKSLDDQLMRQLGESLTACLDVVGLLEEHLQAIAADSESFRLVVEEEKRLTPKTVRDKIWRRNVGEKLRLSFSKSKLDENVTRLRAHNEDFRVLTQQTRQVVSEPKSTRCRSVGTNIVRYRTIGKASCQVYQALQRACTKHAEHLAHFRVEVEHTASFKNSNPEVKFDMAFTHRATVDTLHSGDPVWFLVSSTINEHVDSCSSNNQAECMHSLEKTLKRQSESVIPPTSQKRVKKTVRFDSSISSPSPKPCLPPLFTRPIILGNSISVDLCDFLRRHFRQPLQSDTFVVLEETAQCTQRVYPSQFTAFSGPRKATSLGQLIRSAKSQDSVANIQLHKRVGLARILALAVLQYHSTPWLPLSCRSEDILFFFVSGKVEMESRVNLCAPYINARIQGKSMRNLGASQPSIIVSQSQGISHRRHLKTLLMPIPPRPVTHCYSASVSYSSNLPTLLA